MGRTLQLTRRKCRTKSFSDLQKTIACILERERERERESERVRKKKEDAHFFKKNNNNNCTRLLAAVSCVNLVFPPFTRKLDSNYPLNLHPKEFNAAFSR